MCQVHPNMQKTARNIYTVPDLPVKEIIQYFSEMEVHIKPNDLLKPTPQSTQRIYEIILEIYCGARTSDILSKVGSTDNGAVLEDGLAYVLLHRRMSNFLSKIGMGSFRLKDLAPDSRRLIGILSVVVNFSMFRDNKRQVYERMCQVNDERMALKNEVDEKVYNAKKELERCEKEARRSVDERRVKEEEIASLETELKEFCKHQRALVQETERVKMERDECNDKLSSLQLMRLNLNQDITCLKTQVVSDPTKLMELLEEMRCLILRENEHARGLEAKRIHLRERIEGLCSVKEDIMKAITIALSNRETDRAIDMISREIADMEIQIKNLDSGINALKIRLNHVTRQISHVESKMFNLQDNDRRCSDEIYAKLEKLKSDYGLVSDERSSMKRKIEENVKLTKNLEYEIVKRKNEHTSDITSIQSMLCGLKDDIFNYFAETRGIIDKTTAA